MSENSEAVTLTAGALRSHVETVIAYNWDREYMDAVENGLDDHILRDLAVLAGYFDLPYSLDEQDFPEKCYTVAAVYRDDYEPYCTSVMANSPDHAVEQARAQCAIDNGYDEVDDVDLIGFQVFLGEHMAVG